MSLTYKHVLVAVDGSKEAEYAFRKAIDVAKRNNAQLILTHVVDTTTYAAAEAYRVSMSESAKEYAEELLDGYKKMAIEAGVTDVLTDVTFGSPKTQISKHIAKKYQADLIVCGATGMNAVERFVMGSVSSHISRYAKCDVLVVRSDAEEE